MPYEEGQPTLPGVLTWFYLKAGHIVKSTLLGGRYVELFAFYMMLCTQYECGAILGRAMRSKLDLFWQLLPVEASVEQGIGFLQDEATRRLEVFMQKADKEPHTFVDFILFEEMNRDGLSFETVSREFANGYKSHLKRLAKKMGTKVTLKEAKPIFDSYLIEGIGFGTKFPDLTEKMIDNYGHVDMAKWSQAREAGVNIPEKPETVSLAEREQAILVMVAGYSKDYYPELLEPLNLASLSQYLMENGR